MSAIIVGLILIIGMYILFQRLADSKDSKSSLNQLGFRKTGKELIKAIKDGDEVRAVKLISKKTANAKEDNGVTALSLAVQKRFPEIAKLLIQKGAIVNNFEGGEAIILGLNTKHIELAQLSIENGGNFEATDDYGNTPLHIAASSDYIGIVRFLIEKGANINKKNDHGASALDYAKANGHIKTAQLLKEAGALEY